MTNAPFPSGSGGAPPAPASSSYLPGPSISSVPRRSSYASVVSGAASASAPQRSGAFAHLLNSNTVHHAASGAAAAAATITATTTPTTSSSSSSSSSYPPQYASDGPGSRSYTSFPATDAEMQMNHGAGSAGWRSSGGSLPAYSRQFANIPDYAANYLPAGLATSASSSLDRSFFVPSYLRNSRYVARLEAAHRSKLAAAQREATAAANPSAPLSASSSHVNLHRMAPSHRGMTYDIVEKEVSSDEDKLTPLPSRWNESDKYSGLDLLNDGLEVRYMGPPNKHDHEAAAVRADHPMPRQCGIYYFEVTILSKSKEGMIGVGFSSTKASVERLPGWEQESWAYHGDDGKSFFGENQGQGRPYGPTFTVNDTIGCGVNFSTGCAFFTKNGVFLGNAFRELRDVKLYPSVGMKKQPNVHKEKAAILSEVSLTSAANLQPPLDETALVQELVAQFLAHDGYVETARAFAEEVKQENSSLQNGRRPLNQYEAEEDLDATNRQKIRSAILDGDIDKALKYTNAYYPNVLKDNPRIHFKLRCRKFLEMMRRCNELSNASSKRAKTSNGAVHDGNEVFEQEMDVDDQMQDGYSDADGMDTEEPDSTAKFHELLTEAVQYGQQLRMDYPSDESGGDKELLNDIFSLVAYSDPKSSVHGHYLDPAGRVAVAEELNSAILVSLGKSSSAALERLYQQTEALVNEISEDGGAGAFINVRNDFLL
ncbi:Ran-binding protein (RanBPM) [Rasamsonia emersonii CBS 393.64]|uniref:Protein FYV10 n=1 Tax=Rasamsonia emersonii (strain ATCC 16479 / CBS 393.64 / IMI 116815) TaxID=1408163 RepID=A0A0F4YL20_RASE3|nr:Ran-binding protein (RanBPM) [Rasamsonia emersonii CBS 393.64]KKA18566.1 Ran-binding protein (RanBPM) [Rasamsonia emersonii CBS 393.64]